MCIRSNYGAITAWCATFEKIANKKTPTSDSHRNLNQSHHPTNSVFPCNSRGVSSSGSPDIYRCIIIFLLVVTHSLALVTALSSTAIGQQNMVIKANGFEDFPVSVSSLFKHLHRRRTKRTTLQHPERHAWTPDLVTFVCDELTDPCTRAAFLRRHAYHEICSSLPPLYLLPHIDDVIEGSNQSSTYVCTSEDKGVRSTDGLYHRYLQTPSICRKSLEALDTKIRSSLKMDLDMFMDILERSFCVLANSTNNTMLDECIQCRVPEHSTDYITPYSGVTVLTDLALPIHVSIPSFASSRTVDQSEGGNAEKGVRSAQADWLLQRRTKKCEAAGDSDRGEEKAYWSWVCTTAFPIFYPLAKLPPLDGGEESATPTTAFAATATTTTTTSLLSSSIKTTETAKLHNQLRNASFSLHRTLLAQPKAGAATAAATGIFVLERVPACMTWCTQVETLCPHFNPSDSTSNGGEPTFLCDESHYQYAPPDSPHSVSYYTDCEFDCCFSEHDFLIDVILDEISPPTGPPSHPSSADHLAADVPITASAETKMWQTGGVRGDRGEGEYFSLTERCLHQQLSDSLGGEAAPPVVDQALLRQPSSLSASTLSNAFLSTVTATIVVVTAHLG
ncbi:hypothetical protein EGR_01796 [Echinococcus granulosus]|uniref:Uncharacterized protein n=1 Tax=Echinococcus granulosus TaxID=6210 RepID=W6UNR7_ECHGR|nr:hypothetical protein EGR_01796 [Echinococcus granulosus]EUB63305.1 hypothetical protein EGR_01796 [Echinococcus granulosus]